MGEAAEGGPDRRHGRRRRQRRPGAGGSRSRYRHGEPAPMWRWKVRGSRSLKGDLGRHRPRTKTVAGHHAQHPAEPVLRLHLQRRRHPDCRGYPLSRLSASCYRRSLPPRPWRCRRSVSSAMPCGCASRGCERARTIWRSLIKLSRAQHLSKKFHNVRYERNSVFKKGNFHAVRTRDLCGDDSRPARGGRTRACQKRRHARRPASSRRHRPAIPTSRHQMDHGPNCPARNSAHPRRRANPRPERLTMTTAEARSLAHPSIVP